jgi:hypothetical protein
MAAGWILLTLLAAAWVWLNYRRWIAKLRLRWDILRMDYKDARLAVRIDALWTPRQNQRFRLFIATLRRTLAENRKFWAEYRRGLGALVLQQPTQKTAPKSAL